MLVPAEGLEPSAFRSVGERSIQLSYAGKGHKGSLARDCKPHAECLATLGGLEPPTLRLGGEDSIQLSYRVKLTHHVVPR